MTFHYPAVFLALALSLSAQVSTEKEAALGRQLADEVNRRTPPLDSDRAQSYVRGLGARLSPHVPDTTTPFTFAVTTDDRCRIAQEPLALPGGYIFVPASLFLAVQEEAEFAGMLAHAMEHVAQRHGVRQNTQTAVGETPLIFIGGLSGNCEGASAIPMSLLPKIRSTELEADVLAVQTLARAGFDPNALVRFIERAQPPIAAASRARSAVPDRESRVASMRETIEKLPPSTYATASSPEFQSAQAEVRRLVQQRVHTPAPPSLYRK